MLDDTLKTRQSTYGGFENNAVVAQMLKDAVRGSRSYPEMTPVMREALDQILSKISRTVTGDPRHVDSWHDIAGYATLVEQNLREE